MLVLISFYFWIFNNNNIDEKQGLSGIVNVIQEPEIPKEGENITIKVYVENCNRCKIVYQSYFAGRRAGSGTMSRNNSGEFVKTIGSFYNGTEVWYMVTARSDDNSIIVSDDYIIQIGKVKRSNITDIEISNIYHYPKQPVVEDINNTVITVIANITCNNTLKSVYVYYMSFSTIGSFSCGSEMSQLYGNTFEGHILHYGIAKDDHVYYKIVIQDESNNTKVSPTFSFHIP